MSARFWLDPDVSLAGNYGFSRKELRDIERIMRNNLEALRDDKLCNKGFEILEENLGPVQALRFLALISRQPFDYRQWRQQYFGTMKLAEILTQAQLLHDDSSVQKAGGSRKNKSKRIIRENSPK